MVDEIKAPPLSVQLQMADAANFIQQLAVKEATLARASSKNAADLLDTDVEVLVAKAMELEAQLAIAEGHADFLRRTFEEYGPWVNQRIAETLTADHFSAADLEKLTATVGATDGDFAGLALEKTSSMAETIPGSRKELRDSAFAFKRKAMPVMDWAHVGCTMIDVAIMGGLATCILTEGAGCVVALGGMIAHAALCPGS